MQSLCTLRSHCQQWPRNALRSTDSAASAPADASGPMRRTKAPNELKAADDGRSALHGLRRLFKRQHHISVGMSVMLDLPTSIYRVNQNTVG